VDHEVQREKDFEGGCKTQEKERFKQSNGGGREKREEEEEESGAKCMG
jgi:hypothetical protein